MPKITDTRVNVQTVFNTKNKTLRTTQVVKESTVKVFIQENEVLLAIVKTAYGDEETKSFREISYAGGPIVIDGVVYNDWFLDKKDIISLLSKNNLLYNKVSAIDGIVNVTFTATNAEHSSKLDQIPINGKIGDVVKVIITDFGDGRNLSLMDNIDSWMVRDCRHWSLD